MDKEITAGNMLATIDKITKELDSKDYLKAEHKIVILKTTVAMYEAILQHNMMEQQFKNLFKNES